jgi:hypothetical protein
MSDTIKIIIGVIVGVVVATGAFLVFHPTSTAKFGDTTNYNPLPYNPVSTGVLCNTTSTLLLATSSAGRPFVSISNLASNAIYISENNTPAAAYTGIMIPASTTITLSQISNYLGAINCIAPSGTASTSISAVN